MCISEAFKSKPPRITNQLHTPDHHIYPIYLSEFAFLFKFLIFIRFFSDNGREDEKLMLNKIRSHSLIFDAILGVCLGFLLGFSILVGDSLGAFYFLILRVSLLGSCEIVARVISGARELDISS